MIYQSFLLYSGVVLSIIASTELAAGQPAQAPMISKHISDAILVGFRAVDGKPLSESAIAPREVESGTAVLPVLRVDAKKQAIPSAADLLIPTEAIPEVLGTGVTEIRGKKHTVVIAKLFFIPISWKIKW